MEQGPQQIGKWLILTGLMIAFFGLLMIILGKAGFFRLPGDIDMEGKNWRVFFPITSCIIISILITLILWIINYLRR
ncbi:MAG: DUF2905 domain-containing protein [Candidatus Brocadiia bacterium]|nr:MAG: DUF2905 domain-containing protein [Candidatus Brocadiia bacterium]